MGLEQAQDAEAEFFVQWDDGYREAVPSVPVGFRNTEVAADLAGEVVIDFVVARHRAARGARLGVPPGVSGSFPQEPATMPGQMSQQVAPLYGDRQPLVFLSGGFTRLAAVELDRFRQRHSQ